VELEHFDNILLERVIYLSTLSLKIPIHIFRIVRNFFMRSSKSVGFEKYSDRFEGKVNLELYRAKKVDVRWVLAQLSHKFSNIYVIVLCS
jgi:hypothetical protein